MTSTKSTYNTPPSCVMLHRMSPALAVGDSASVPERAALSTASTASAERRIAALGRNGSSERAS